MSQATDSAQLLCLKNEEALSVITNDIRPSNVEVQTFGAWRAITQSQAEAGMNTTNLANGKTKPTQGGVREVTVEYVKMDCSAAGEVSDVSMDCTDVDEATETYGYDRNSVDQGSSWEFAIDGELFQGNCLDLARDLQFKLRSAVRAMIKKENDYAIDWLYASAGNYFAQSGDSARNSRTNPYPLSVLDDTRQPSPMGLFPLIRQYEEMGLMVQPYVVSGAGELKAYSWADRQGIFARGNDDGVDPSTVTLPNFFYDLRTDPRVINAGGSSTNYAFSFAPGAVANINWFEYANDEVNTTADGRKQWLPYQLSGPVLRQVIDIGAPFGVSFPVDALIYYDYCNNKVIYKFVRNFDYWKIPDDAFVSACDQQHNYILMWTVDTGALADADFGQITS